MNIKMSMTPELAEPFVTRLRRDPVFFCRHILGTQPWGKQIEVLRSLRDHGRVAVRSGHGTGKSFVASLAALWFLYAFYPAKVITTAPTMNQVKHILWPEIRRLFSGAKIPLGGTKLLEQIKISDEAFAIGLTTDEPERFQGYHAENILVILDEAPGVQPEIWEVAETLLTGFNGKILAIGNPTQPAGLFYEAFRAGSPWRQIHISCLDSPNAQVAEDVRPPFPSLVTRRWINARAAEWGTDSPIWKSRVLGEFPDDKTSTLIPRAWLVRATLPPSPVSDGVPPPRAVVSETSALPGGSGMTGNFLRLGVDVARHGSDDTVFLLRDATRIIFSEAHHDWDTMQTTGRVIALIEEYELEPESVSIDDTGLGAGVTDRLHELGYPVTAFISAASPEDRTHFLNARAECFWRVRQALQPPTAAPLDDKEIDSAMVTSVASYALFHIPKTETVLHEELAALTHSLHSAGKIKIAAKIALRGRLSRSPNHADALAMTFITPAASDPKVMIF